jgi:hypothetical protein
VQDPGDAVDAVVDERPTRRSTKWNGAKKKPSTTRQAAVLLVTLLSYSTSHNNGSLRTWKGEWTMEMVMEPYRSPCLGTRTPMAADTSDARRCII